MLRTIGLATVVLASLVSAPAAMAGNTAVAPLVSVSSPAPVTHVADAAPAAEEGGKKWFAFKLPENMKPELEEKKILLLLVSILFSSYGGNILGPILLSGAAFDMEWAGPSLLWLALEWGWLGFCLPGIAFYFVGLIPFIVGEIAIIWIGAATTLTNLNRPEIKLGKGALDKK